jgi:hypothetical protein
MMRMYKVLITVFLLIITGVGVIYSLNYFNEESNESDLSTKEAFEETASNKIEENIVIKPGTVVYQIPGMEEVNVIKDIVYKVDKDAEQKLDVYYPSGNNSGDKPYPVILIHGRTSDKKFKDTEYFKSWGKLVAASGFAAVTFGWRCDTAPEDISDLMVYVREHTEELGIDSRGVSVIAFSAGVEDGIRQVLSVDTGFIDSIAAYYGVLPLSVFDSDLKNEMPPIFIAKAGLDSHFSTDCNDEFISKAAEADCVITELVHPEGVHGFDVYANTDKSREIIKESLAFIYKNKRK